MKLCGDYAVHLHRDGTLYSFLPGDDVPGWAAKQITNPHVWEDAAPELPGSPAVQDGVPAKSGPGASRQAWEDYAVSKGVAVHADWKREDIIAAVENAG